MRRQRKGRLPRRSFKWVSRPAPYVYAPLSILQAVADAYYVLSDPTRRREYDSLYSTRRPQERTAQPDSSANFFSTFANMFAKAGGPGTGAGATGAAPGDRPDADYVFADVFEDVRFPCDLPAIAC